MLSCFQLTCFAANNSMVQDFAEKPNLRMPPSTNSVYRLAWFDSTTQMVFQVNQSKESDGLVPDAFNANFYRDWCSKWCYPANEVIATSCLIKDGHWVPNSQDAAEKLNLFSKPPFNLPRVKASWFTPAYCTLHNDSWWIVQLPLKFGFAKPELRYHPPAGTTLTDIIEIRNTPKNKASKEFRLCLCKKLFFCALSNPEPITFDLISSDPKLAGGKTIFKGIRNNSVIDGTAAGNEGLIKVHVSNVRGLTKESATIRVWSDCTCLPD